MSTLNKASNVANGIGQILFGVLAGGVIVYSGLILAAVGKWAFLFLRAH